MRIVLFFFIISSLEIFITLSSCRDDLLPPLKLKPRILKKIQILNPRKFLKVRSDEKQKWHLKKRVDRKAVYTVFPAIVDRQDNAGVPDSPFFQPEMGFDQKIRVKKVLPDYLFSMNRKKRSLKDDFEHDKKFSVKIINKKNDGNNTKNDKSKAFIMSHREKKEYSSKISANKNKKLAAKVDVDSSTVRQKHVKQSKPQDIPQGKHADTKKRLKGRAHHHTHADKQGKTGNEKQSHHANKESRRLIAGKEAMIEDYPYVVSIQKAGEHWCAGALLNPRLVITTANCVWKSNRASRLRVRAGSRHVDRGGQVAKIQEVMKHPAWSIRGRPDHDVALLLLDRNIKFSDSVHAVDLPNRDMTPAFEDAWVTSWGTDRRDGVFDHTQRTLQAYSARRLSPQQCSAAASRFGVTVSRNFVCLAQTGRRSPCTRDTGAPAVSDGALWGLASWGIRKLCGTERFPSMFSYTAAPSNLAFITNATRYLMAEQRRYRFPDRFPAQRGRPSPTAPAPDADFD